MKTNVMLALIKREVWEHKSNFFRIPLLVGFLFGFVGICAFVLMIVDVHFSFELHQTFNNANLQDIIHTGFYAVGIPFVVTLWLVLTNYFLACLYDDRKDRSILFWHSMPISHAQEVGSKLIAGLVIAPLYTFIVMLATELVLLILGTLALIYIGGGVWLALWHPLPIISTWISQLVSLFEQVVWLLPILMWFLLCSAYSKKAPFLRALVPVVLLVILELFFIKQQVLWDFIVGHISSAIATWHLGTSYINGMQAFNHASFLNGSSMMSALIGIIISIVFVVLSIYMRKHFDNQNL